MKNFMKAALNIAIFILIYNITIRIIEYFGTIVYKNMGIIQDGEVLGVGANFATKSVALYVVALIITYSAYFLIFKKRKENLIKYCDLNKFNGKACALAASFGFSLNVVIMYIMCSQKDSNTIGEIYDLYMKSKSGSTLIIMFLSVAFLIPIFEEIIYRGLVFNEMRKYASLISSIIMQAVLFGILEIALSGTILNGPETIYGMIVSSLFACFYVWSGSIWTSIFARSFKNCASLIIISFVNEAAFVKYGTIFVVFGTLVMVASVFLQYKMRKDKKIIKENKFELINRKVQVE